MPDSSNAIVLDGICCTSASANSKFSASKASLTFENSEGSVVISKHSSSALKSSAPLSRAIIIMSSSDISVFVLSITITPFLLNIYATHPEVPKFPPDLSNAWRTSAAVLFLLSVFASTITATPFGP